MYKTFNVTGLCIPEKNYMVNKSAQVEQIIGEYILPGKYFTINRARQFGKTTTLYLLEQSLKDRFLVLRLSFEYSDEYFASSQTLAEGLLLDISDRLRELKMEEAILQNWEKPLSERFPMRDLGKKITDLCRTCGKKVILMIDEVDKSSDNQVFLSFLGMLRAKYLDQQAGKDETFWSVILAGVYDVKTLKQKIHPGEESKYNSPWNIAADFTVDMSFSSEDIASMLRQYEDEWGTGMDVEEISGLLYDYTSGYPFLVSRLCQILASAVNEDSTEQERKNAWSREAFQSAVREILKRPNTLFDDMTKKLADYPRLKEMIGAILLQGRKYSYETETEIIRIGEMFGFLRDRDGVVSVSNRIFEMKLYNLFLSEEETDTKF